MRCILMLLANAFVALLAPAALADEAGQQDISYMKSWPKLPNPFVVRDWKETARRVTLLTLDGDAAAPYFPVTKYFLQEQPLSGGPWASSSACRPVCAPRPLRPATAKRLHSCPSW